MYTHHVRIDDVINSIAQNMRQLKTFWNTIIIFLCHNIAFSIRHNLIVSHNMLNVKNNET